MTDVFLARRAPLLVLTLLLAGCGAGEPVTPAPAVTLDSTAPASSTDPVPGGTVQAVKRVVLLDPGHNGGNATNPTEINRKVPDGRRGTKECNTTGTATDAGYPEHAFTWDVAKRVRALLTDNGVTVLMTRNDDKGVGPCVDVRGAMAEKVGADAVVSIHADGAEPSGRGFHVAYSAPPLSQSQGTPSVTLATALRDALRGAGLPPSDYLGSAGLAPRSDLAGLNLSRRPTALVECANMRNAAEAGVLSNPIGRQRYANAIANGILAWLARGR